MKIMKRLEMYLELLIEKKSLEIFKKEFPTKAIDLTKLLPGNEFKLELVIHDVESSYRKIKYKVQEDILIKLIKNIDKITK